VLPGLGYPFAVT